MKRESDERSIPKEMIEFMEHWNQERKLYENLNRQRKGFTTTTSCVRPIKERGDSYEMEDFFKE